jgi:hypothetical protein
VEGAKTGFDSGTTETVNGVLTLCRESCGTESGSTAIALWAKKTPLFAAASMAA